MREGDRTVHRPRWLGARGIAVLSASLLAAGLGSGFLVWQGTTAVFNSTTANGSSAWATATVSLTDDDSGSAMFNATNLVPSATGSNCITVSYGGTVATTVKLYASASADASTVAQYVNLVIQEGSGGTFNNCTGFASSATLYTGTLAAFTAAKTNYSNGVGTWAPSSTASKVYKITYTLDAATPNAKQGATTTATFQWEAQA